jgi:hypothetical protein
MVENNDPNSGTVLKQMVKSDDSGTGLTHPTESGQPFKARTRSTAEGHACLCPSSGQPERVTRGAVQSIHLDRLGGETHDKKMTKGHLLVVYHQVHNVY